MNLFSQGNLTCMAKKNKDGKLVATNWFYHNKPVMAPMTMARHRNRALCICRKIQRANNEEK